MLARGFGSLLVVLACGVIAAPVGRAQSALHVIPFPHTPDASPSSQIIFSALRPSALRSVRVAGSRSGAHAGRLTELPDAAGMAFTPNRPFTPGEVVRVSARLSSPRAGTASGVPGATQFDFTFRVMPLSTTVLEVGRALDAGAGEQAQAPGAVGPTQHFHSEPALRPPLVTASKDQDASAGEIFLTAQNSPQVGPMILNSRGQLVWFDHLKQGSKRYYAANFAVQRYEGHPVLTWWQGAPFAGEDVILNRAYQRVAVVKAGDGYKADVHEFQITPQGTAWIPITTLATANLTAVGGPKSGVVVTNIIQEVDIRTGQVLWEWHALGHVPVAASYERYSPNQSAYDYFHLNSIQQLSNGNLLISARNTWAVYEISRQTGRVIWTLGGKDSNFAPALGASFAWQHDARLHPGGILSLFDDASNFNTQAQAAQSSAKLLRIDLRSRTVSLVRKFVHSPRLLSGAAGSTQVLSDGSVFVGWGAQPDFSEYNPEGKQIFNGAFAPGVDSYRAFRFPWAARPKTPPALAVKAAAPGQAKLYASWNGATQVAAWRVLGGHGPNHLAPLGITARRTDFETAIDTSNTSRYFAVQAIDRRGRVLGTSAARPDPSHRAGP